VPDWKMRTGAIDGMGEGALSSACSATLHARATELGLGGSAVLRLAHEPDQRAHERCGGLNKSLAS